MSRIRVANLLDDFALGGVTKGLGIYEAPEFADLIDARVVPINAKQIIAPKVDADVILTHFPPNWRRIAFLASLKARNPNAALVHVEHSYSGDWEHLHVPNKRRFRTMMRTAFRLVDHLVCVSDGQARWVLETGSVQPNKLTVIRPYGSPEGLAHVPARPPVAGRPLVIGAYGRFHDAKGFDTLIDAMKLTDACDNLELVLGGFGPEDQALRARAAGDPRIRFVGKVTDVAGFLSEVDIVAVPSRYEAYGQVANEAREAGRPILVSMAGGLPEQVGDAGLIIDCSHASTLASALQGLRVQPLAAMARAGRESTRSCRAERIGQWSSLFKRVCHRSVRVPEEKPSGQWLAA